MVWFDHYYGYKKLVLEVGSVGKSLATQSLELDFRFPNPKCKVGGCDGHL